MGVEALHAEIAALREELERARCEGDEKSDRMQAEISMLKSMLAEREREPAVMKMMEVNGRREFEEYEAKVRFMEMKLEEKDAHIKCLEGENAALMEELADRNKNGL